MVNRLYVSFWDLCLHNLPQGRFERRVIGAGDASQMIRAAHTDKTLLCVSKDDLLAPYRTRSAVAMKNYARCSARATTVHFASRTSSPHSMTKRLQSRASRRCRWRS